MSTYKHSIPLFVIDVCSMSDDHQESKSQRLPRSFSLLNYGEAYKDLSGTIHYSSLNRSKSFLLRSHSCPMNSFSTEKSFRLSSSALRYLDPHNGICSPTGSSSHYSLYGSFFDLSEKSYRPSLIKTENQLLSIDGRPLLVVENPSKLSTNTYQDKCTDWLSHLNPS